MEGAVHILSTWKRIVVGKYNNACDLRKALNIPTFYIAGSFAYGVLDKIPLCQTSTIIDLVVLTTKELTGKRLATLEEIFEGASRLNLKKCPSEVGPYLREQYLDQPDGEWLLIAMDPLIDSRGASYVFKVEQNGSIRWLGTYGMPPDGLWGETCSWVFMRSE